MATLPPPTPDNQDDAAAALRAKKRKLEEAFHSLDDAVHGPPLVDRPSAPKRPNLTRSLYSSLAKYGIKGKEVNTDSATPELDENSKKTPHLTAILARAASRTKHAFTFKFPSTSSSAPLLPPGAEYRPSSVPSFLSRLETFKLATYSDKPTCLDAVAAARCGWTNNGKDRLVCGLCHASWVVTGRGKLNREAANALVEKQRQGLVDNHKSGCPWRTRQCDASIYCIPLKSPTATAKEVKANAVALDSAMEGVSIRHPLTPNQLASLHKTIRAVETTAAPTPDIHLVGDENAMDVDQIQAPSSIEDDEPSENAIVASLFGWSLAPATTKTPTPLESRLRRASSGTPSRISSPSISRQSTPGPATPRANTPRPTTSGTPGPSITSISRRSSFSFNLSTPGRSGVDRQGLGSPSTPLHNIALSASSVLRAKRDNITLQCVLCQRRIGLWAFMASSSNNDNAATAVTATSALSTDKGKEKDKGQDEQTEENSTAMPVTPRKPSATASGMLSTSPLQGSGPVESISVTSSFSRLRRAVPQRHFDLLKEHRSYCPYVVKSTTVPSLPSFDATDNGNGNQKGGGSLLNRSASSASSRSQVHARNASVGVATRSLTSLNDPNAPLEGWRANLTVLLRYGMAQRQRAEYDVFGRAVANASGSGEGGERGGEEEETWERGELDNVRAMVNGVKQRGGRDLLKYVKGLLG